MMFERILYMYLTESHSSQTSQFIMPIGYSSLTETNEYLTILNEYSYYRIVVKDKPVDGGLRNCPDLRSRQPSFGYNDRTARIDTICLFIQGSALLSGRPMATRVATARKHEPCMDDNAFDSSK
jgi:hypothetical protein